VLRDDGTIEVPGFDLPASSLLDPQTRDTLYRWARWVAEILKDCPGHWSDREAVLAVRKFYNEHYSPILIERSRALYDVAIQPEMIAGVYTEIFTPSEGVPSDRAGHVLINLHGGGFTVGARTIGQIESIPIASMGRIKVISVDYRMAPEYQFPAATDDVIAVYRSLLRDYAPENIGIYGCSAGAVLTAQTIARLQKEKLALPAAVGMFCAAGSFWNEGDSAHFGAALLGIKQKAFNQHPYFENADPDDPLVAPVRSSRVLAGFPPSLLIASTRDVVLSSVVHMHSRLTAIGVNAELHVWEGLQHAFFYNPNLPQSCEVHRVAVKFFDRHLFKS